MKLVVHIALRIYLPVLLMVTLLTASVSYGQTSDDGAVVEPKLPSLSLQIKTVLAAELLAVKGQAHAERVEGIVAHYRNSNLTPIWIAGDLPTKKAHEAVSVLRAAGEHGLDPMDYNSEALFQMLGARSAATLADLEVQLSRSVIAYAQHLNAGRVAPHAVNREIVVFPKSIASEIILSKIRSTKSIQVYLRLLAPHTPRYERLRIALDEYRLLAANGGWTNIPDGPVLKPAMADPRIPALRQRLIEFGIPEKDLPEAPTSEAHSYDDNLVEAVKKFQINMGLEPDGVIGAQTVLQLNTTVEERIRTMELNLERRRWMQNNYGRYYVFANLADQAIKLVRDEKTLHHELIQVGQPYHRTPVFSDEMEYIELNPYWNVPHSIATKEYLPKLKSNPGVLNAQKIRVLANGKIVNPRSIPWNSYSGGNFPVRLRQDSGPGNALGRVKFMFPNKFSVYIHDTPSKAKFNRASRYFSHGCLRLHDPLTMAEQILGEQGWSRTKIDAVVKSGKRRVVKLEEKIPVHVTYLTAWVNKDGSIHFRRDIYGRDKILDLALKRASGG